MEKQFVADKIDPLDRVDGRAKVTGSAKYFADADIPGLTYGVLVISTVAKGRVKSLNTSEAERSPGVFGVISHLNAPKVPGYDAGENPAKPPPEGKPFLIFQSDRIYFNGQPIAVVVADTLERAQSAARLVKVQYEKQSHITDFDKSMEKAVKPAAVWLEDYKRGNADAFKNAPVVIEKTYTIPMEFHNPMELHGMIAQWNGEDKVTVYAKTQGVKSTQQAIMEAFKLKEQDIKVYSQYVGGGFGNSLRTWPHEIATVIAAKKVNRPVKLMLTRDQMFLMVGYRPQSWQKIGLGATQDGKLIGITHHAISNTSSYEEFTEGIVNMSKFMYACPNVNTTYRLLKLDLSSPIWMRGPGEATGSFALESALDELAYALDMDPIELRIKNYAEADPERNRPWSSRYLKEAYQLGADKIEWKKRSKKPGALKEDGWLVGYGMASGVFSALRWVATVRGKLSSDGSLKLQCATADIGPGTATAMVLIASEAMGLPADKITFELGNADFPPAPVQGGSATVSTVGSAVHEVCVMIREKMLELIKKGDPSLKDLSMNDLSFKNGEISFKNTSVVVPYSEVINKSGLKEIEIVKESKGGPEQDKYSMYSYSVHFVRVHVHPSTGQLRVTRVVSAGDAGKIISYKTAESQMIGGVVGGIGMALHEEAVVDHRYGRVINNNFADYHVPVNADVPQVEALFVNIPDPYINPMGAKGMGEIALIGLAAALANAVYNATGKRIRDLPITPDKLI